jgi:DNA-binding beta-propeller fold protein YncE
MPDALWNVHDRSGRNGHLAVAERLADSGNHQIIKCDAADACTRLAGAGVAGFRDGAGFDVEFHNPGGVAFHSSGTLYVADTGNHVIRACNLGGACNTVAGQPLLGGFQDGFGLTAYFNSPLQLNTTPSGAVLIADTGNHAIRQFEPATGVVTTILGSGVLGNNQLSGPAAAFAEPAGVATDESDRIYVSDTFNHRIAIYDGNAMFLMEFGTEGVGDGEFNAPRGATLDTSRIYVVDAANNRVQVFLRSTPAPATNCLDDTSAAIAAAREYQKATREVGKACERERSGSCQALLSEQQVAFDALTGVHQFVQASCR